VASPDHELFDPAFVAGLFDRMAASYERVNELTSFGFSRRWRRQAVGWLDARPGDTVLDAMTGMGEGWRHLAPRLGPTGRIIAVDLSPGMLRHAGRRRQPHGHPAVDLRLSDALVTGLPDASVDRVLCLFGTKTLSPEQQGDFANEIARVLRPGGRYALIEVSVPPGRMMRAPYLAYLRHAIPVLGRLLLGDPGSYRMLAVYTTRYRDSRTMADRLREAGLETELRSVMLGCATGVTGHRPT
jgi:demethylmenaquinone methyltransferase/2-methoxy-6-polyprenyl-1,4-benzoquinol methylase